MDLADSPTVQGFSGPRQSDEAYDRLKADIILCRLAPGAQFSEIELSKHYGMGRAALRSALTRLCEVGFIESVPRKGFVVTPITIKSVKDLFEMRVMIEPGVAELATPNIDTALLRELNLKPQDADTESEQLAFLQSNHSFHVAIAEATGNQRLSKLVSDLLDEGTRLVNLGLYGEKQELQSAKENQTAQDDQHEALIDAFERRDAAGAREAARVHIEHSQSLALERIMAGRLTVQV